MFGAKSLVYEVSGLTADRAAFEDGYHEFLKIPTLSSGIYELKAGAVDGQSPHDDDEIYYVIEGKAVLRVEAENGWEDRSVSPGSILFVAKKVKHYFHSIETDLRLLVFFSIQPHSGWDTHPV